MSLQRYVGLFIFFQLSDASGDGYIIYPNPAGEFINVLAPNKKLTNFNIRILSMEGRTVYQSEVLDQAPNANIHISLSKLASAYYLIYITETDGNVYKQVFKKE